MLQKEPKESRHREIFLALVEPQDQNLSVPQSRRLVAQRFGVSVWRVCLRDQEGLDNDSPPF